MASLAGTFVIAVIQAFAKRVALPSLIAAGLLTVAINSHAAATADAAITIASFRILDAAGANVAVDPSAWLKAESFKAYSSAQASELLQGESSFNYQVNGSRQAITPVCSDAPAVAGLSLGGSACTSGMPGTMHSGAASALFNSSAAAHGLQYFSFMLPAGFSFEISGSARAHASSSGVPDSSAGLSHLSAADAGIVIGPQQFELRGFSASANAASDAAHTFAESTQATPFNYSTTNSYPYAIAVLLSWSSNASVSNAALAVPEASTVAMMLAGLLLIGLWKQRSHDDATECPAVGVAAA